MTAVRSLHHLAQITAPLLLLLMPAVANAEDSVPASAPCAETAASAKPPRIHNTTVGLDVGLGRVVDGAEGSSVVYLPGASVFIENDPAHPGFAFWRRLSLGKSSDGPNFMGLLGAQYAGPWWKLPFVPEGGAFEHVRIFGGLGAGIRDANLGGLESGFSGDSSVHTGNVLWFSLEGDARLEIAVMPQLSLSTGLHFSLPAWVPVLNEGPFGGPVWVSLEPISLTYRPRVDHPHFNATFARGIAFGMDLGFGDYSAPASIFIENDPAGPKVYFWWRLAWLADGFADGTPDAQGTIGIGLSSPPLVSADVMPGPLGALRVVGGAGGALAKASYAYYVQNWHPKYLGMGSLEYFMRAELDIGNGSIGTGVRVSQPFALNGPLSENKYPVQVAFEAFTLTMRIKHAER